MNFATDIFHGRDARYNLLTSADDLAFARSVIADYNATAELDFLNDDTSYYILVTLVGNVIDYAHLLNAMKNSGYKFIDSTEADNETTQIWFD